MCFLEFFEALIGCAIKSHENSQTLIKEESLAKNESKSNLTQPPLNNNSMKSISSLNANTNTIPTKLGSKTETGYNLYFLIKKKFFLLNFFLYRIIKKKQRK